jgi:hypothetical protein
MADYYSVIATAVSRLPSQTDEARCAIYDRARTALQEGAQNATNESSRQTYIRWAEVWLESASRVERLACFAGAPFPRADTDSRTRLAATSFSRLAAQGHGIQMKLPRWAIAARHSVNLE